MPLARVAASSLYAVGATRLALWRRSCSTACRTGRLHFSPPSARAAGQSRGWLRRMGGAPAREVAFENTKMELGWPTPRAARGTAGTGTSAR